MFKTIAGTAAILLLGAGATAQAEQFKDKSGRNIFIPLSVEDAKQPDGTIVRKVSSAGISVTDLPFPYDIMKSECRNTVVLAADGKSGRNRGLCENLSSKGDRATYWVVGDLAGGRYEWIEGTGAYAGIKGGGTYRVKAVMPGGGSVVEWLGSWQSD
ncbi:hypothetical protein SAMN02990966_06734 [Rhodospirillales bacterium URHD0017]|nr:hypothetical protein SAMN02990966_06734 [Rhodospirillales bacterium URHD0017]